ncbi:MAG: phenylacetate-coenzyme A ligase PaaK-like adenylate-forming protein, partial [Candidatus Krumholzibacteriia bacterium]
MSRILSNILLKTMRPDRMRILGELNKSQWLTPAELQRQSTASTQAMLRHAASSVPFYQEACRAAGLDASQLTADDLSAFPLITKQLMMARTKEFIDANAPQEKLRPNATGGSSGIWF